MAGLHGAVEKPSLPAVWVRRLWAPAAVEQHEDFLQNSLPQQDVDPGVEDLVPCGYTHHHQKSDRPGHVFASGAQHDDMELVEGVIK